MNANCYPIPDNMFMVEKWIFTVMTVVRFLVRAVVVTALGVGVGAGINALNQQPITVENALQVVMGSVPYLVIIGFMALTHIRLILFRLGDIRRAD